MEKCSGDISDSAAVLDVRDREEGVAGQRVALKYMFA